MTATSVPLRTGTTMIQSDLLLPRALSIRSQAYASGWRTVQTTSTFTLEREVLNAGWHMLCIAGRAKTFALGLGAESSARSCMQRLFGQARKANLNCVEVTKLKTGRFLGIPYASVQARFYQIQESYQLLTPDARKKAQGQTSWANN